MNDFKKNGYLVFDFLDPSPIYEARESIQEKLNEILGREVPLENYHAYVQNEEMHTEIQSVLTHFFRDQKFNQRMFLSEVPFFKELLGGDILIQKRNYLRIARPGKFQDNIGYHRDTFYGGSPYELSVMIPYIDLNEKNCLKVLPGSHLHKENHYPTVQKISEEVTKGSKKHDLGFLYAAKEMDSSIEQEMIPMPLKVGQGLVFSLAIVHGCVVNQSDYTRWSSDVRLLNQLAPVDLSSRMDYYEILCQTPVSMSAEKYLEVSRK